MSLVMKFLLDSLPCHNMNKITICLTGGIASGKTLASSQMEKEGFQVVDADLVAREVVRKGSQGLSSIVDLFGQGVLTADGELNRKYLKNIVFNDSNKLKLLNGVIHPLIEQLILEKLSKISSSIVVLVIPLLNVYMVKRYDVQRVLVVDVDEGVQMERVIGRDGIDKLMASKIMSSQMTRADRLQMADDIIVNNTSIRRFKIQLAEILAFYKSMTAV